MTNKLTIKIAVFRCDLTLVAKYAFSQALSHLEIRLPGSKWDSTTGDGQPTILLISSKKVREQLPSNNWCLDMIYNRKKCKNLHLYF